MRPDGQEISPEFSVKKWKLYSASTIKYQYCLKKPIIYRENLFISVTGVFLLTIFTSVNFVLFICKNKYLIKTLLNRSDAAGILASDHIYNLLWKTKVFFSQQSSHL